MEAKYIKLLLNTVINGICIALGHFTKKKLLQFCRWRTVYRFKVIIIEQDAEAGAKFWLTRTKTVDTLNPVGLVLS